MNELVTLTIDGMEVKAPASQRILWAALDAGIYIPHLCAVREAELPWGACRLCHVEANGRLVAACSQPVTEGMVIKTDTPRIGRLRRSALDLLMSSHPDNCRTCAKQGQCDLIEARIGVTLTPQRLERLERSLPVDSSNPFFIHDPNYCILCGKCVWVCRERQGAEALDFYGRGIDTIVRPYATFASPESRCESDGWCVAVCPTAALVPKNFRYPTHEVNTICPYCAVGCGLRLGIADGAIVSVEGEADNPASHGSLCVKGRFGVIDMVQHSERLTLPLVRRHGVLEEASWDEALGLVASELARHRGRLAVLTSGRGTNEDLYVLQKFARVVMGTNNIDGSFRAVAGPALEAIGRSLGHSYPAPLIADVADAACILAIGANVTRSHPIVGLEVRKAARRGAEVIAINPREIDLCRHTTLWLRNRPGSDALLLMGMMRILLDEGLADTAFIQERCQGFAELEASLKPIDLAVVAETSGVPVDLIAEVARCYARLRPSVILAASGISRNRRAAEAMTALLNLALLAGNVGPDRGGLRFLMGQNNARGALDMGAAPHLLPGRQPLADDDARRQFEAAWGCPLPNEPGLDAAALLRGAAEGDITALYVVGANPALSQSSGELAQRAFERLDFLVVQDLFLTETARHAHVVLPAAAFAEKSGTFTNLEGRVQHLCQALERRGEARPDWWIASHLAQRLGAGGFEYETASAITAEIARLVPGYEGAAPWRLPGDGQPSRHKPEGHRWQFVLTTLSPMATPNQDYPLALLVERSLYHFGTETRRIGGLNELSGGPTAEVSSEEGTRLGLQDGEAVRIVSPYGAVTATVRLSEASPPGTVRLSPHFPESPLNRLGSPDASFETPSVRIEKAPFH